MTRAVILPTGSPSAFMKKGNTMTREKMVQLLTLLNPQSAKVLSLAGVTDEALEILIFHEAYHIKAQRRVAEIKEEDKDYPSTLLGRLPKGANT
jgi:hypothetical protein